MSDLAIPDRFEVLAELAVNRVEVLLHARDRMLGREVFLKRPGPGLAELYGDREMAGKVLREARALARVQHPGVVRLLDVLETSEGPLLVIETVSGESLSERLTREGPLEPQGVLALGRSLAAALEAVHQSGLVHRGIGTGSVLIDVHGEPRLTGFHLARAHGLETSTQTCLAPADGTEATGGLAPCAAPELVAGQAADARSDVFALGWVLFEAATGEAPFQNPARQADGRRELTELVPDAPPELARTIARCLAQSPLQRYPNGGELRAALEGAGARATARVAAPARPRWLVPAALATAAAIALAFGLRGFLGPAPASAGPEDGLRAVRADVTPGTGGLAGAYHSSYAFLIGIGDAYEGSGFPPLANAERDIEVIAQHLRETEGGRWQVETLRGAAATREVVIESIARLADRTKENDRVFIYYAGHGEAHERSENSGWLIPADASRQKRSSWVRFDELFRFFEEASAKHILVAMDCCYGGRLTAVRSARVSAYQEHFLKRRAHVVIASGRRNEQVSDGTPGEHSPFAAALMEALGGSGPLTSTMLFAQIQETFTGGDFGHSPQFGFPEGSPAGGEFVFFRDP